MEQKITLRDLNGSKTVLLRYLDVVNIEEVKSIELYVDSYKSEFKVNIGLYNYLFNDELKSAITRRIKADLNLPYLIKFGV
jgi:hypothetical protein